MKIKVTVGTNKVGSEDTKTIEIDDDSLTEESIEEIARDQMFEMIYWNYEIVEG